jgi:hypothetical protein
MRLLSLLGSREAIDRFGDYMTDVVIATSIAALVAAGSEVHGGSGAAAVAALAIGLSVVRIWVCWRRRREGV